MGKMKKDVFEELSVSLDSAAGGSLHGVILSLLLHKSFMCRTQQRLSSSLFLKMSLLLTNFQIFVFFLNPAIRYWLSN